MIKIKAGQRIELADGNFYEVQTDEVRYSSKEYSDLEQKYFEAISKE